jgi:NAD(P)-dependent dehydrogenase (short-subunit alcohol dehydrogenase family)
VSNKRVLITGGCSGLGRAMALQHVVLGNQVTVADISAKASAPEHCQYLHFDCAEPNFDWLTYTPQFDILICNAGISNSADFQHNAADLDRQLMQINTLGHIALVRALLRQEKLAHGGNIVFIISACQYLPFSIAISYSASKAALDGFAHALEPYVRSRNIAITRVYPGPMNTPHAKKYYSAYQQGAGAPSSAIAKRIIRATQLRRRQLLPDWLARLFWLASVLCPSALSFLVWRKYHRLR